MKNTQIAIKSIISNFGFQTNTGVLDIVLGTGLVMLGTIRYFRLPFVLYSVAVILALMLYTLIIHYSLKPRIKKNPDLLVCNIAELIVANILVILAIVGGLYILWISWKGVTPNPSLLLFIVALYAGISVIFISIANRVNKLIIHGQLIVLFTIMYCCKILAHRHILLALIGLGIIAFVAGLIQFRRFVTKNPK